MEKAAKGSAFFPLYKVPKTQAFSIVRRAVKYTARFSYGFLSSMLKTSFFLRLFSDRKGQGERSILNRQAEREGGGI